MRGQKDSEDPERSPAFKEWVSGGITTETGDPGGRLVPSETGAGWGGSGESLGRAGCKMRRAPQWVRPEGKSRL